MAALQALVIYILVAIIEEDGFSPKLLHVMSVSRSPFSGKAMCSV